MAQGSLSSTAGSDYLLLPQQQRQDDNSWQTTSLWWAQQRKNLVTGCLSTAPPAATAVILATVVRLQQGQCILWQASVAAMIATILDVISVDLVEQMGHNTFPIMGESGKSLWQPSWEDVRKCRQPGSSSGFSSHCSLLWKRANYKCHPCLKMTKDECITGSRVICSDYSEREKEDETTGQRTCKDRNNELSLDDMSLYVWLSVQVATRGNWPDRSFQWQPRQGRKATITITIIVTMPTAAEERWCRRRQQRKNNTATSLNRRKSFLSDYEDRISPKAELKFKTEIGQIHTSKWKMHKNRFVKCLVGKNGRLNLVIILYYMLARHCCIDIPYFPFHVTKNEIWLEKPFMPLLQKADPKFTNNLFTG